MLVDCSACHAPRKCCQSLAELASCGSVKCLPILTNGRQELLLVTPNLQQSTRETPWHAIDTFPSVTLEARRRGKRVTISFSYLTLDFLLLQLLGRSGRGRKATRSRRRLCALHSCWTSTHEETNDVIKLPCQHSCDVNKDARAARAKRPKRTRALQVSRGIYFNPLVAELFCHKLDLLEIVGFLCTFLQHAVC